MKVGWDGGAAYSCRYIRLYNPYMRWPAFYLVFCGLSVLANHSPAQFLTPEGATAAFREARSLAESTRAGLWGKSLYGPMIFVDPTSNTAISNQADASGILKRVGEVYQGKLPDSLQSANTAVEWEGTRWTLVQWPLPNGKTARERLLAHEMFHRIQPVLGLPLENAPDEALDSLQARIWTFLEWRALAAALAASPGPAQSSAIADAISFRKHRRDLFPASVPSEQTQELNEGLAEYTGVIASEPDAASARWHAIARLSDPSTSQSLVRSFAYTSGPAYALLLDEISPGWRRKVSTRLDLASLLQIPHPQDPRHLSERTAVYGAASIRLQEVERKLKSDVLKTQYRAALVLGPTLTLPIMDKLDFSFDPGELIPLDEGMVYPTLHASDEWGSIEVTQGALVSFPRHILRVAGPVNSKEETVTGPGWVLKLAPGWMVLSKTHDSAEVRKR